MISWLMLAQAIAFGVIGAIVAVVGLMKRPFNDFVLGAAAFTLLALVVQAIASIIAPFTGAGPTGDLLEYWTYLLTALVIPPGAVLWALVDKKGQWSTLIVGIGILACAVMVYRMHQIWFVQIA
ncbi:MULTISPECIES: hypothetical protein [Agrococcus]|uniref:Major facilitator superfamily (MFS) profile domain-containing protein n=1 Tax=Agrococcus pavilionensis RW1 TaxID=1330458 RepID=U1MSX7_9MICO|nr:MULTISPECIES: hypothetical protein [Agrococcus]ERG63750.1 hypothetical protein L332_04685 [Agrococcus pavilionensis RW1]MBO1769810.1 hypothetical protein [Agrococcus sp. TF02-05]